MRGNGFPVLGSIQWLLLRRWVSQSGQWVLANVLGGLPAAIIVGIIEAYHWYDDGFILGGFAAGLVIYTGITGVFLMRLLRHPISKP